MVPALSTKLLKTGRAVAWVFPQPPGVKDFRRFYFLISDFNRTASTSYRRKSSGIGGGLNNRIRRGISGQYGSGNMNQILVKK